MFALVSLTISGFPSIAKFFSFIEKIRRTVNLMVNDNRRRRSRMTPEELQVRCRFLRWLIHSCVTRGRKFLPNVYYLFVIYTDKFGRECTTRSRFYPKSVWSRTALRCKPWNAYWCWWMRIDIDDWYSWYQGAPAQVENSTPHKAINPSERRTIQVRPHMRTIGFLAWSIVSLYRWSPVCLRQTLPCLPNVLNVVFLSV